MNGISSPLLGMSEGLGFYVGKEIQTKLHAHHAVEIVLAVDKPFMIRTEEKGGIQTNCCLIAADFPHCFLGQNDSYLFIYIDPELSAAKQLEARFSLSNSGIVDYEDEQTAAAKQKLGQWIKNKMPHVPIGWDIVYHLIYGLTNSTHQEKPYDPRVVSAIRLIESSLHEEINLHKIAMQVFLSPSRFAHLFSQQTSIPFRRYVLWCRMQAALKAIIKGYTLTQAAYEGGFADVAHLSRTFTDMFGISPSKAFKK